MLPRFLDWLTWRRVALLSLAGAVLTGARVYLLVPQVYSSKASLLMSDQPDPISSLQALGAASANGMAGGGGASGMLSGTSPLQRFEPILRSRKFSSRLIAHYGLTKRYQKDNDAVHQRLRRMIAVKTMGPMGALGQGSNVGMEITVSCPAGPRLSMWLGRHVPFTPQEAREMSAAMANDALEFLDTYTAESSVSQARSTREFLERREQSTLHDLAEAEQQLLLLQRRHSFLTPDAQVDVLSARMKAATQAVQEVQGELRASQGTLQAVRTELPAETAMRIERAVSARNPTIVTIEQDLMSLQSRLQAELASGKLVSHPDVTELQEAVREKQSQLAGLAQTVQQEIVRGVNPVHDALVQKRVEAEIAVAAARARDGMARAELSTVQAQIQDLPPVTRDYMDLSRQVQMQAELLDTIVRRLELARIEEQRTGSGKFQVLDRAEPPLRKSAPSTTRSAILVFILLFVVLSLARGYRSGLFSPPEDT